MRVVKRLTRLALALSGAALVLAAIALPAAASRELLTEKLLKPDLTIPTPPPEGQIEAACGLAVAPGGRLYVSDYYHHAIDRFSTSGGYESQVLLGNSPEGPCGLAVDSTGRLYANLWHQSALRLPPDAFGFEPGHVTGIAVDPDTDYFYVDHHNLEHHSYVSAYLPNGEAAQADGHPLDIGLGSLKDAYGLAVRDGRVYVADASDAQIKVYEPAKDPDQPAFTIGGFNSLIDAALTIDPTNGHLLVVDNLQPLYEHPIAAIVEYEADGTLLGRLPGAPVHGEPSGIAVDPASGDLYVTDGNDEEANVFAYGPYQEGAILLAPAPETAAAVATTAVAIAAPPASATQPAVRPRRQRRHRTHRHRASVRVHAQTRVGGRR